jgi:S-(hydroxymethyl)mycothiol dehydrogenase
VTRGVVFAEPGAAPAVEEIVVEPPGAAEAQVRIEACGVCHSDLHVVETDGWGMRFPILLGHEGAGVVEAVGEGVTSVAPGDRVVVAWRATCGDSCRACRRGDLRRCSNNRRIRSRMFRADGTRLTPVLRSGAYADRIVVHESAAVKMPDALPLQQACLLACGFSTGAGAALWTTPVQPGSSVAVIGCGGVGLAVVQGARLAGAASSSRSDSERRTPSTGRRATASRACAS